MTQQAGNDTNLFSHVSNRPLRTCITVDISGIFCGFRLFVYGYAGYVDLGTAKPVAGKTERLVYHRYMILFEVLPDAARQIKPIVGKSGREILERDIQKIFEKSLHEILGVHFLASEYSTSFGGRMDTLGIDDDGNPCIIEYKKGQNENVINQGLSYLRWLLDHKENFNVLCQQRNIGIEVQWDAPRVICIAENYSKL